MAEFIPMSGWHMPEESNKEPMNLNQANQVKQMNQANQVKQMNQENQMNQVKQENQMNQMKLKDLPIAMAYVPLQEYGETYGPEAGLSAGTLFPDLDKPFYGKRQPK